MGNSGWRIVLGIILAAGVMLAPCRPVSAASMNVDRYIDVLARQHGELQTLLKTGGEAAAMQGELDRLAAEALPFTRISLGTPQGALELDGSWVRDSLLQAAKAGNSSARRAVLERLERRMRAALEAVRSMGELAPADAGAREALARIFERHEFRGLDERENWFTRLRDRLNAWLRSLARKSGGALRYIFNVPVAVAVVLLSLAYVAWRLALRPRPSSVTAEPPERRLLLSLGHDNLARQAGEAAAEGQFRQAVRLLYLALLARLDRAGRIHYLPWRTNWEYLGVLRAANPPLADAFAPFTWFFERKWYGMESCDRQDYDEGLRLYQHVLARGGL